MIERFPLGHVLGLACLSLLVSVADLRAVADEWQVRESPVRYKLRLTEKPTHPSAGYFAHLPDGGILPDSTVTTVVMTMDGKVLPSYLLWQNAENGFSIVFADPGNQSQEVYVYVRSGGVAQLWKPESGITPSPILCTFAGRAGLNTAFALAKLGRVDPSVHFALHYGGNQAVLLSLGGDLTGRPRPGSFYLLAYVEASDAGKYTIAPYSFEGQCEVLVDGKNAFAVTHEFNWVKDVIKGDSVELSKGLHRVEVFQTARGTGEYNYPQFRGLMFLRCLRPGESNVAPATEDALVVRSGACELAAVEAKNGGPVAAATANSSYCYWFGNEEPLILYNLKAVTSGQPADATYKWTFPKEGEIEGPDVQWIFPAFRECKVRLTVKSGQDTSTCIVPFFSFSTKRTDLGIADQRAAYKNALAAMLKAFPSSPDPVADWSPSWWNNLMRTVEGKEEEGPLLDRLFSDHFDILRRKLTPEQLFALQDLLLDVMQRQNPTGTLQRIQKFQSFASASRRSELKLREGEVQMYYLGDRKQAEKIFTEMFGPGDQGDRTKIRLGDLAFMDGDLNKSTAFYADVQRRARSRRNAAPLSTGLVANQFVQDGSAQSAQPGRSISPSPFQNSQQTASGVNLKRGALQEVSLSENVRSLTNDGYFLEARQALLAWETEFPLSKISGDYIMRESALFIKMGDWKRARPMLEAYCRQIDASAYLPEAASMLVACIQGANETPSPFVIEIIKKVRDRLKYHPAATDMDSFLSDAMKPSK